MEQQISSDLIRGHIDTIILHTLIDNDKFAEQISDTIAEKSENAYKINQATLYSALKRLENLKFVTSYQKDADIGGRRKFFSLTEIGRNTVETNLSSWSYSRAIIDKLIDAEPQPIYKTQIVEVPVVKVEEKIVYKQPDAPIIETKTVEDKMLDNNIEKEIKSDVKVSEENDNLKDVNFRNILNGLIQTSACKKPKEDKNNDALVELKPIEKTIKSESILEQEQTQKFTQKIAEKQTITPKINTNSIDFSDLMYKASQEGYKLRVSSKQIVSTTGTLLVNKLNLFVWLCMSLILLVELFVVSSVYGDLINMKDYLTIGLVVCIMAVPFYCWIKFKQNPLNTSSKKIHVDIILTTTIIVFNLLLINFACVLLFNLDFSVKKQVVLYVIIPFVLYIDMLIYSIIKYFLGVNKSFSIKYKKNA